MRIACEREGMDAWRDIPGYGGRYQASLSGRIRRVCGSGKTREMAKRWKQPRKGPGYMTVHLTRGGRSAYVKVSKLVAATFLPGREGSAWHRNGITSDDSAANLEILSPRELGRRTGKRSRSRAVVKVLPDGSEIEIYRSARQAGRENHMSGQAVMDRCNGKVKNEYALDGSTYRWEEGRD